MMPPVDRAGRAGILAAGLLTGISALLWAGLVLSSLLRPDWAVRPSPGGPLAILLPTPGNQLWAAAFVGCAAAAAISLRRLPRLGRYRELIVIGVPAVITVTLGLAAYLPCSAGSSWASVVAWTLNLFAGGVESNSFGPGAACPATYPLGFEVARMTGLATIAIGAVTTVAALSRQQLDRWRIRRASDVDIVVGVDQLALALVKALVAEQGARPALPDWYDVTHAERRDARRRGSPEVVVVHPNRDEPALGEFRAAGARILVGEPTDPATLAVAVSRAGAAGRAPVRPVALNRLFAAGASQQENLAVLAAAETVLTGPGLTPDRWASLECVPRLAAFFDDPRDARDWMLTRVDTTGYFVDALSVDGLLARSIVAAMTLLEPEHVLILGDSPLSVAILDEIALTHAFRAELDGAHGVAGGLADAVVTLVGADAVQILKEWRHNGAPCTRLVRVECTAESWEDVAERLCADGVAVAMVIADAPSRSVTSRATRLTRLYAHAAIFEPRDTVAGLGDTPASLPSRSVVHFGPSYLQDGGVPEDAWTVLARQQHDSWGQATPQAGPARASRRSWGRPTDPPEQRLPQFFRDDNLRQLRMVLRGFRDRGYVWRPVLAAAPEPAYLGAARWPAGLPSDLLEEIAEAEHQRWLELRREHGWSLPDPVGGEPVGQPDEAAKLALKRLRLNPACLPWSEAPPSVRAGDREAVIRIVDRLRRWGITPVRLEGGAAAVRFRRRGEVRAQRLADELAWRSSGGSPLSGRPGDWWVEGPEGSGRSVAAAKFPRLYEPLGGDRYRRRGEVTAVPADAEHVVETLEGPAAAASGMWIVSDDQGNSWPVPDEEFRRGYEPI